MRIRTKRRRLNQGQYHESAQVGKRPWDELIEIDSCDQPAKRHQCENTSNEFLDQGFDSSKYVSKENAQGALGSWRLQNANLETDFNQATGRQNPQSFSGGLDVARLNGTSEYVSIVEEAYASIGAQRKYGAGGPATPVKPSRRSRTNTGLETSLATEEDARKAGIPAGYSYKNWNSVEEPILLLGSVFDANSLVKWLYDWTVFWHGLATPVAEMAGDMWLLLIQLAGKIKRAEETMHKIKRKESHETVEDFLESGERLWIKVRQAVESL